MKKTNVEDVVLSVLGGVGLIISLALLTAFAFGAAILIERVLL